MTQKTMGMSLPPALLIHEILAVEIHPLNRPMLSAALGQVKLLAAAILAEEQLSMEMAIINSMPIWSTADS